jgi:hypothetical protein
MSYVSSSDNSLSSGYSTDDAGTNSSSIEKGDVLVDRLDVAVHAGDWAIVAAIGGDLSQADDISTMSSFIRVLKIYVMTPAKKIVSIQEMPRGWYLYYITMLFNCYAYLSITFSFFFSNWLSV